MEFVFGTLSDGREVKAYTLIDGEENAVVLDYGCALQSLSVLNAEGRLTDVVLGYDTVQDYETKSGRFGAVMGRCVNRIAGATITIDDKDYALTVNKGDFHAHGGKSGFDKKLWKAIQTAPNAVRLTYRSADGEEGYPGNLDVTVTYTLQGGALTVEYQAVCDKDTVVNLTNHSYFNLDGGGSVLSHTLQADCDRYIPTDAKSIPYGYFESVEGTPLDFRAPKQLADGVDSDWVQIQQVDGYDIHLQFAKPSFAFEKVCTLTGAESGIAMSVYTDRPGMQLFSANSVNQCGKGGVEYAPRCGICFETQLPPDATHHPAFESAVLRAGETFTAKTQFAFQVKK